MDASALDGYTGGVPCQGDPELFFPLGESTTAADQIARAKELCAECPVRRQCREYALTHPRESEFGIWGGMTTRERRALLRDLRDSGDLFALGEETADGADRQVVELIVSGQRMPGARQIDRAHAAVELVRRGGLSKEQIGRMAGIAACTVTRYVQRADAGLPLLGGTKVSA